jgi:transposase
VLRAIEISRTELSAEALRAMAAKSRDGAQVRRLLAIALVLDGNSRTEAAEQSGMDPQTLRDRVHRYDEAGIGGLVSRIAPGPRPLLNEQQMAALKALVIAEPEPEKDGVVRWRCVDPRREVIQRFSVT